MIDHDFILFMLMQPADWAWNISFPNRSGERALHRKTRRQGARVIVRMCMLIASDLSDDLIARNYGAALGLLLNLTLSKLDERADQHNLDVARWLVRGLVLASRSERMI
jgi:hypothetical protein